MRARRRRTADADGAFWPFLTYRMPGMRRWFLSAMNFKHTICLILAAEQKPSKHKSTPHSLERQARRRYTYWRRKHSVFYGLFCTEYNFPMQH